MAVGCLAVKLCKGKGPGVAEESFEVIDGVEDGNEVEECGDKADGILSENGFRDVDSGAGKLFGKMGYAVTSSMLVLVDLLKVGSKEENTYGVPTAKAPFNMPAQKTKPSLVQPAWFCHSFQTKLLLACPFPVFDGMIAHTMIVMKHPSRMRASPMLVRVGRARLANMTTKQEIQVMNK